MPKRIRTTYDIVTPESAKHGDVAEQGWEDEEGVDMEERVDLDQDPEFRVTAVDAAVEFLTDNGATSRGGSGMSFYTVDPEIDYATGEETSYGYHLVEEDWTDEEVRAIGERISGYR